MDFAGRIARLRERLRRERAVAMLVTHPPNLRYLVNFSGSNGLLLVTADRLDFFTDGRYREQAAGEVVGAKVRIPATGDLWKAAAKRLGAARRVAVEAGQIGWAAYLYLKSLAPRARLLPARDWVEELRMVKEPEEIAALRAACLLAAQAFEPAIGRLRPGMSETQLAGWLELELRQAGGEGTSFDTIVASGWRAALPHGQAREKAIQPGELAILDYGVWRAGYSSDTTRTVALARAGRREREVYRAVWEAQQAAIAAIRPGASGRSVDEAARRVLRRNGLGEYFTHSTGHGLGLEVHELPRLSRRASAPLIAGQVVTVEPGVYLSGWGGVRIEDVVAVTEGGAEVLTPPAPAELPVL